MGFSSPFRKEPPLYGDTGETERVFKIPLPSGCFVSKVLHYCHSREGGNPDGVGVLCPPTQRFFVAAVLRMPIRKNSLNPFLRFGSVLLTTNHSGHAL
jgi:hypothetical protein